MEKPNYTPTSADTREAEKMLSPKQAAMTTARSEILSHEAEMKQANLTTAQVEEISNYAGEKVKQEFEQKETEDPLLRLEKVLAEAAETEDEKKLAEAGIKHLEDFRSAWSKKIKDEELKARHANKPFHLNEFIKTVYSGNTTLTFIDNRGNEYFPGIDVLHWIDGKEKGTRIEPSNAFQERILKKLGVLGPDQTLETLKLLPSNRKPGEKGGIYKPDIISGENGSADRIPTNITGVDLDVSLRWPRIFMAMDVPTLEKAISHEPGEIIPTPKSETKPKESSPEEKLQNELKEQKQLAEEHAKALEVQKAENQRLKAEKEALERKVQADKEQAEAKKPLNRLKNFFKTNPFFKKILSLFKK